jgi:hypothetical protein
VFELQASQPSDKRHDCLKTSEKSRNEHGVPETHLFDFDAARDRGGKSVDRKPDRYDENCNNAH